MSIIKGIGGVPEKPPDEGAGKPVIKKSDAQVEKVEFTTIPSSEKDATNLAEKAKQKLDNITQKVHPERAALREADQLVERAKLQVAQMFANAREEAKKEADKIIKSGRLLVQSTHEEARQLGFKEGKEDGKKAGREELAGLVENLKDAFGKLLIEKDLFLERAKEEIAKLTLACVKEILIEEIKTNPETVLEVAKKAVEMAKGAGTSEVTVYVNSEDKELVSGKKEIFAGMVDLELLKIKSDPSITRGGCRISTQLGSVDATIETQLQALEIAFEEVAASGQARITDDDEQ